MANIKPLPTAIEVIVAGVGRVTYGPHCIVSVVDASTADLVYAGDSLVRARLDGDIKVDLSLLSPSTVPYVNKFIAHSGQQVILDWRTKTYRLKGASSAPKVAPAAPKPSIAVQATPAPLIVVEDEPAPTEVENAPILVAPKVAEHLGDAVIPGLSVPPKVKVTNGGKGYTRIGDIVVPDEAYQTLVDALALRKAGDPAAVSVTGPAGTAKTALVRAFAASEGLPFLKVDGGAIRTADDWAGAFRQDPNTKTWAHRWSPFAQVLRAGRPAIILIDELNRTESPQALNALLGLLDWSGSLLVPDANAVLTLPSGILVVMTANIGPEFVGTLPIDGAVRQRFPYGIRLDYPVEPVEAALVSTLTGIDRQLGTRLVKMAALQRLNREDPQQYPSGSVISTRVLLDIARRIAKQGTDPREAVMSTLRGQFDPGDDAALSVCIDTQFPAPVVAETETAEVEAVAEAAAEALIVTGKHWYVAPPAGLSYGCDYRNPGLGTRCGQHLISTTHHTA